MSEKDNNSNLDEIHDNFVEEEKAGENPNDNIEQNEEKPKTDVEIIEDLKDQLLRQKAEFVNYQNRAKKELEESKFFATKMIIFRLVPVLDEINRAKEHEKFDKDSPIASTLEKLEKGIKDIGVIEFGEVGDEFDPNIHEAFQNIEKDGIDKTVVEAIVAKGYKFGDSLIRTAQVITATPKNNDVQKDEDNK